MTVTACRQLQEGSPFCNGGKAIKVWKAYTRDVTFSNLSSPSRKTTKLPALLSCLSRGDQTHNGVTM